ncbi:MAG: flavodoxin-dependent (E)-4-hydroxy-3-methylbut-2-enyl-diphosphate synthase [Endomicrobia bacterium]|nr:flavodoxin-dependent (E)-4-hydroxy-3-methylbut-2-enyl-diphosphate synthase [Endomicrobiia bacterium]
MKRKKTIPVKVGNLVIGGNNPIIVQTMTKTDTKNVYATIRQINEIQKIGGKLVRVAVPNVEAAEAFKIIKKNVSVPLVADIHFDYKIAIECIKNKADKIRINPANIKDEKKLKEIIEIAKEYSVPIRIGLNSGSYKRKLSSPKVEILQQAEKYISLFEKYNFKNLVISAKTSDVVATVEIYQSLSKKYKYPLHIGITEAGPLIEGTIKSTLGIGLLLWQGIGDTIRVSLTSTPLDEIKVGNYILQYLNLAKFGIELISCPTCGRTKSNLQEIVENFKNRIEQENLMPKNIKVAIMGCEVNGPGEAASADIGVALSNNLCVLFIKGKIIKKLKTEECIDELLYYIRKM